MSPAYVSISESMSCDWVQSCADCSHFSYFLEFYCWSTVTPVLMNNYSDHGTSTKVNTINHLLSMTKDIFCVLLLSDVD